MECEWGVSQMCFVLRGIGRVDSALSSFLNGE